MVRFEFGRNWLRFLSVLTEERIVEAERSLVSMLGCPSLEGKTFLDVGSGSGLFSLAARRLGARVHSFDYDPDSVACTAELKKKYFPDDARWVVEHGSVLDRDYMRSLPMYDIVYSWGVLHHTGDLQAALANVHLPVQDQGLLFLALYNDQGARSVMWRGIKRIYCSAVPGRMLVVGTVIPFYFVLWGGLKDVLRLRNPVLRYVRYRKNRGMSVIHDWYDWLGGYPFEVARPKEIVDFYEARGFAALKVKTTKGLGNNEFVFKKSAAGTAAR